MTSSANQYKVIGITTETFFGASHAFYVRNYNPVFSLRYVLYNDFSFHGFPKLVIETFMRATGTDWYTSYLFTIVSNNDTVRRCWYLF